MGTGGPVPKMTRGPKVLNFSINAWEGGPTVARGGAWCHGTTWRHYNWALPMRTRYLIIASNRPFFMRGCLRISTDATAVTFPASLLLRLGQLQEKTA